MTANKITISDIERTMLKLSQKETMLKQPLAEDVITLDDSSDEDNGNAAAPVSDACQNNMGKNTSEDASLLATLRLLASLDSGAKKIQTTLSRLRWKPW